MKDMKLIMEGWREYNSVDEQYDQALAYLLESYDGLLTEAMKDDVKTVLEPVIKRFGKTAATLGLVALIATAQLAPGLAAAADQVTAPDLPVAAQQMDADEAKKIIDMSEVGQELKDIFGKDGKLSKLFKKKAVDDAPEETPETAPEPQPEGFSKNAKTGGYEFRVAADSRNDPFAERDARRGMQKSLAEEGLAGLKMSQNGDITSTSGTIYGLGTHYDQANEQFVATWSEKSAETAQEMSRDMQQMSQQMQQMSR